VRHKNRPRSRNAARIFIPVGAQRVNFSQGCANPPLCPYFCYTIDATSNSRGTNMPEPRLLKVFLCHSSSDKPLVRELYQKLSAEGWIDPWLDEEKLYPGQDWNLEIEKAVEAADAILVCLSNNSITKEGYVQRELRIVLDYADFKPEGTLYIIPMRLEACEPPRRLRPWQYADYFPETGRDRAYQRLLISLQMRAQGLGVPAENPHPRQLQLAGNLIAEKIPAETRDNKIGSVKPVNNDKPEIVEKPFKPRTGSREGSIVVGDMEFMLVPAGRFVMGSKDDDKDADNDEKPQHTIELSYDYYLARFTVTNEHYNAFIKATNDKHPVSSWEKKADHPVVNVSWLDAMEYVKWLNTSLGSPQTGLVFRLPTEAEWEKAARGAYGNLYPWGNEFDQSRCNSRESGKMNTMPVDAFPRGASPYGCEQMSGNVREWTHTLLGEYPYASDEKRENEVDQTNFRVVRGGAFHDDRQNLRAANRQSYNPDFRLGYLGFRVVLAPKLP
jgi:formylglycine-generating enzyme required for sulfatase activity